MDDFIGKIIGPLSMGILIVTLTLLATTMQVRSQERRWRAERKESAYLECLKLLQQSRCYPRQEAKLSYTDFLDRLRTFQLVEPWIVVAGNSSSAIAQKEMEEAVKNIKDKIALVMQEPIAGYDFEHTRLVEGCGLPEEIDKALQIVIKHCKHELKTTSLRARIRNSLGSS